MKEDRKKGQTNRERFGFTLYKIQYFNCFVISSWSAVGCTVHVQTSNQCRCHPHWRRQYELDHNSDNYTNHQRSQQHEKYDDLENASSHSRTNPYKMC